MKPLAKKSKDTDNEATVWFNKLKDELVVPFEAKAVFDDSDSIPYGTKMLVTKVDNYIDMYGMLVEVKVGRFKYIVPLCEVELTDKKSVNYKLINKFLEWWDNLPSR
ncbi:MAG: hypothetical protein NTU44_07125 [Bacteroidetes bacterium]|nr:hypothetical protein [Bacteroidota bacterium]